MSPETGGVHRLPNMDALAEQGAELFAAIMRSALVARPYFTVALSGGSTPRGMYERLTLSPYDEALSWSQAQVFFGDERMVPAGSPESNYRMARTALLDHVPVPAAQVHHIHGELPPDEAARLYANELRAVFALAAPETEGRTGAESLPRFDLILLGLGPDGHTASLFPNGEKAWVEDRLESLGRAPLRPGQPRVIAPTDARGLVAAVHLGAASAGAGHADWRVTLTLPVLNAARHVVFLVAGADKAEPLRRVLAGDPALPAAHVHPHDGTLTWLVVEA